MVEIRGWSGFVQVDFKGSYIGRESLVVSKGLKT